MEEHVLVTFSIRGCFQVARSSALDLHTASSFLLNVLDVGTTMSNNLSAQVESMNGLQGDWDLLFGPFALWHVSVCPSCIVAVVSHSSEFVSFHLLLVSAAETSLIDELGKFLLN